MGLLALLQQLAERNGAAVGFLQDVMGNGEWRGDKSGATALGGCHHEWHVFPAISGVVLHRKRVFGYGHNAKPTAADTTVQIHLQDSVTSKLFIQLWESHALKAIRTCVLQSC